MSDDRQYIGVNFPKSDTELYKFVMSQVSGYGDASQWMRGAAECLRLIQTHANGQSWQEWIERASNLMTAADAYNATMKGVEE